MSGEGVNYHSARAKELGFDTLGVGKRYNHKDLNRFIKSSQAMPSETVLFSALTLVRELPQNQDPVKQFAIDQAKNIITAASIFDPSVETKDVSTATVNVLISPTQLPIPVTQAADELGYHPTYVKHLIKAGRLIGYKLGRNWFVDPQSVTDFNQHDNLKQPEIASIPPLRMWLKPKEEISENADVVFTVQK